MGLDCKQLDLSTVLLNQSSVEKDAVFDSTQNDGPITILNNYKLDVPNILRPSNIYFQIVDTS